MPAIEAAISLTRALLRGGWLGDPGRTPTVPAQVVDPKTGVETPLVVREDDGVRVETTMESLSKLATIFKKNGGTTTAGNSSQVGVLGLREGGEGGPRGGGLGEGRGFSAVHRAPTADPPRVLSDRLCLASHRHR
jgi:hypothetical protein